jgi:hypothetical protein
MKKLIIVFCLLTASFNLNAQNKENEIRANAVGYNAGKKEVDVKCFSLTTEEQMQYQVIVFDAKDLIQSKEIEILLPQNQKTESFVFTIKLDDKDIIKTEKLIAIPFLVVREQLINKKVEIKFPEFLVEEYIPEIYNVTQKDLEILKKGMENWIKQ